jgi:hypothetical protein
MTIDTSREAIERDAANIEQWNMFELGLAVPVPSPLDYPALAAKLRALLAERDAAFRIRDDAIKMMGDASREAGSWRGISEGKNIIIRRLEAERDAARADIATAFARGAEAMRERAADKARRRHMEWDGSCAVSCDASACEDIAAVIHALPLPEMEAPR